MQKLPPKSRKFPQLLFFPSYHHFRPHSDIPSPSAQVPTCFGETPTSGGRSQAEYVIGRLEPGPPPWTEPTGLMSVLQMIQTDPTDFKSVLAEIETDPTAFFEEPS